MTVAANYGGNDEKARAFTEEHGIPAYKWDVSDHEACQRGVARVVDDIGPVDVLVNNAGITRDVIMLQMTYEMRTEIIDVTLAGCFNNEKGVISGMLASGKGRNGKSGVSTG